MEVLVPLMFFAMIVAIIVVPAWLRERTRQSAHELIAKALEKGQTLDPAMVQELTQSPQKKQQQSTPRRTLGNGLVLLALGGAFAAASYFSSGFDPTGHSMDGMMTAALILGALGVAFTVLAIVDYSSKKKDAE